MLQNNFSSVSRGINDSLTILCTFTIFYIKIKSWNGGSHTLVNKVLWTGWWTDFDNSFQRVLEWGFNVAHFLIRRNLERYLCI